MAARKPQRNTRQRQVVLEELQKLTSHPTAAELYEFTRGRLPKISLGTVYRNLEVLVRMGLAQKLDLKGAEARFDGNPKPHYHVRCVGCGRVDDIHDLPLDPVSYEFESPNGYEIVGVRLEFVGVCPECQNHPAAEDSPTPHKDGQ